MTSARKTIKENREISFQDRILDWYDRHRRVLPWRALPGQKADPYHVWLSEIMLQQTTVGAVIPYFTKFLDKWPTVQDLAAADQKEVMREWAGLGYYARARNLHACAKVIAERGGIFPSSQAELKKLPGIGDYTSAAIAAIAFNKPANVVDGNVERVMARYFKIEEPLPDSKKQLKSLAADMAVTDRPGDYAQALMDLGATICTPKSPKCVLCPVNENCEAFAAGVAEELPRKKAKSEKPQKQGYVYWIEDSAGRVLLHRRSEKGMLGGMVGFPSSEWGIKSDTPTHIDDIEITEEISESVYHSFTHFDLQLFLFRARFRSEGREGWFWCDRAELHEVGFPTLFGKALRLFDTKS